MIHRQPQNMYPLWKEIWGLSKRKVCNEGGMCIPLGQSMETEEFVYCACFVIIFLIKCRYVYKLPIMWWFNSFVFVHLKQILHNYLIAGCTCLGMHELLADQPG